MYNERKYKTYRNKLNHVLQKAEKQHFSDLLSENKSNLKKTWQTMKYIVNKNKRKKNQSEFKLNDGIVTKESSIIANKFNDFFCKYWTKSCHENS